MEPTMKLKRALRKIGLGLLGLLLSIATLIFWAQHPALKSNSTQLNGIRQLRPTPLSPQNPQNLRVVSYNLGYAYGDKNNLGEKLNRASVEEHLQTAIKLLRDQNPDLILLQEVDLFAKRSSNIDQVTYLQEALRFPYAAVAVTWNKNYVAWPYWPPSRHFGRIVSGQAVLSRFPIRQQNLISFPKPQAQAFWYRWFYLDRIVQSLQIQWGTQWIKVYNVHLEAFDETARSAQLKALAKHIAADSHPLKIVGGDFNQAYRDQELSPQELKNSRELLRQFTQDSQLLMMEETENFLTFPSWKPTQSLDHLFYSSTWRWQQGGVLQNIASSDHLPVWGDFLAPQAPTQKHSPSTRPTTTRKK